MLGRRDAARIFGLEIQPVITRRAAANWLSYDKLRSPTLGTWTPVRVKKQLRLRA
jgi:hypothetical protein